MRWKLDVIQNERGVSLLEIMVALVIFGIGLVVAVRTLPESNAKTTQSRNRSIAVNLAQEGIEELMGRPFNHADLAAGTHDDPDNPVRNHFERQWVITDNTPVVGMKQISVSVEFPAMGGIDSTATLRTFKSTRQ